MDDIELPLVGILRDMERRRRAARRRAPRGDHRARAREIRTLEAEIWELAGTEFVLGSPQQLGEILFEKLGLSRKRRGKTGFSTDARVLQAIRDEHEIIPKIERWRELNQLDKTYFSVLPQLTDAEGRIHTTFLQAVAITGRLASTNPNMQNVPIRTELGQEIRGCFEAAPGNVLLSADYSQIELRVLAHIADEPVLKEIFVKGEDVHTATASQVFRTPPDQLTVGQRSQAKMINYGIVYGLSDYGLADRLGIPREEAKAIIDAYLDRFPAVRAYIEAMIAKGTEDGYVTTLWGRRRQIPELKARNWSVRTLGERLAVNSPIQGTAADVLKLAMVRAHEVRPRHAGAADPHRARRAALRRPAGRGRGRPRRHRRRDGRGLGPRARRSSSTSGSGGPGSTPNDAVATDHAPRRDQRDLRGGRGLDRRQRRTALDRGFPRRRARRAAVGGQRLPAHAGLAHPHRRVVGRPVRRAARLHGRGRRVRRGVDHLRRRADDRRARRSAGRCRARSARC